MNEWDITKAIIDVEAAERDIFIQQRLIEMGWIPPIDSVTRVEVIENGGRSLTRWLRNKESMYISMQDNNKTMKIFIEENK